MVPRGSPLKVVPPSNDAREHRRMDRALRAPSRVDGAWRLLAPLLIAALLFTAQAAAPAPVDAGGSSQAKVLRKNQIKAESDMRRAQRQIVRLKKERAQHKKLLKKAKKKLKLATKRRKAADRKAEAKHDRLDHLELTLARTTKVRPNPSGRQKTDKPALRKQIRKLNKKVRSLEKKLEKAERKERKARKLKQSRLKKPAKARIAKRRSERDNAEARVIRAISAMDSYASARLGRSSAASGKGFSKPVRGSISQRYGCTGFRTNPRRGSCGHFHDGVDITAPAGARIKASADGIVTFVGFSPWDPPTARAYTVRIVHRGGYETVYGHLKAVRQVKAGQRVKRGDVIGIIGSTGTSTGRHLHWERGRGARTVEPLKIGR